VSVVVDSSLNIGRRPYLLLNDAEIEEFMAASSGEIRKVPLPPNPKFQGAQDLYRLSDVYFNARRTFAFTIINRYCGSVCGSLNWHAFGKSSSGKWEQKFSCYGGDA
jgi:hypothetical protein